MISVQTRGRSLSEKMDHAGAYLNTVNMHRGVVAWLTSRSRTLLEYRATVWDPCIKQNVDQLEQVQRQAALFILIMIIIIIIRNTYIAPNPTRLAQSTSQFKTRMNIRMNTWNMHTPDDPSSNANSKVQANMHTSRNNQCNPDMQCSNTWTHLMIANQIQRAS